MVHYLMHVCMTHTYGCTYIYTPPLLLSLPLSTFLTLSPSLLPYGLPSYILSPILLHLPSLHSFLPLFTASSLSSILPPSLYCLLPVFTASSFHSSLSSPLPSLPSLPPSIPSSITPTFNPSFPPSTDPYVKVYILHS